MCSLFFQFEMIHQLVVITILTHKACFSKSELEGTSKRSAAKRPLPLLRKKEMPEQEIIQAIMKNYDWRVRPYGLNESYGEVGTGGPVLVTVNFLLRTISKIDDVNMEYSAQFTFREEWVDRRLAYSAHFRNQSDVPPSVILAIADNSQQIWMPDTFFQNEKEARKHNIDKPNVLIRIHRDGKVLYSVRLSLVLSCPMDLKYYPLDRQTCLIDLASYAYTTEDVKYSWKIGEPVQRKPGLENSLPSFSLQGIGTGLCTSKTNTGEYSCLRIILTLKREYSFYLLQLYIPSMMLVIASWINFWIDKDAVPARVSLGITTLLTMTTQASGIQAKLPPVSYTKAIDVWIGTCLAFLFSSLLEYALVNYAGKLEQLERERQKQHRFSLFQFKPNQNQFPMPISVDNDDITRKNSQVNVLLPTMHPGTKCPECEEELLGAPIKKLFATYEVSRKKKKGCNWLRQLLRKHREISKRIDVISRFLFPIIFAFFNAVYWTIYLV